MSNDALVLLAALASIRLAQGLSSEQLELLSAFFEILGDNLALLALGSSNNCDSPHAAIEEQ